MTRATRIACLLVCILALGSALWGGGAAAARDLSNCSSCHAKYPADSFDRATEQGPVSLSSCWPCHGGQLRHYTAVFNTPYGAFSNAQSIDLSNSSTIATIHLKHKNTVRWTNSVCLGCHVGAACTACHSSPPVPHEGHTVLAGGLNNYSGPTETYAKGLRGTTGPYTYSGSLTCTGGKCHGSLNTTFVARPDCLNCHKTQKIGHPASVSFDEPASVLLANCWPCHGGQFRHYTATYDSPYGAFTSAQSIDLANPSTIATIHASHKDTVRWTNTLCANCHRGAACASCHAMAAVVHGSHTSRPDSSTAYPGVTEVYAKGMRETTSPYTYTDSMLCTNSSCHSSMNTTFVPRPDCSNCHVPPGSPTAGIRGTMQLDEGALETSQTTATVNSSISGATEMRFKSVGDWLGWQPYAATAETTISSGDGAKTVYAEYRAASGSTMILSDSIVLDTRPPGVAFSTNPATPDGGSGWFRTPPTVALARDESGTTCYQWDSTSAAGWVQSGNPITTAAAAEGSHSLYYWASDVAGNAGAVLDQLLKVDSRPPDAPTVSSSSHVNEDVWYSVHDVEVSWTATDPASGVSQFCYTIDTAATTTPDPSRGSVGSSSSAAFPNTADGRWYFHVRACDTAGNWGSTSHRQILIKTPTPPGSTGEDCASCHPKYPSDSFDQISEYAPVSLGTCWPCHGGQLRHYTATYGTPYGAFTNAQSIDLANPATIATIHAKHKDTVRWTNAICANCHRGAACTTCHDPVGVAHRDHAMLAGGGSDYPGVSEIYSKGMRGTTTPYTYSATLTCTNAGCHGSMSTTFVGRPSCLNCHTVAKTGHGDVTAAHASTTDMSRLCLTSGCHTSGNLVVEHESRGLACVTCHANPDPARAATLQAAISAHDTSCASCHPVSHPGAGP